MDLLEFSWIPSNEVLAGIITKEEFSLFAVMTHDYRFYLEAEK
jgi:hypothetical protein